MTNSECRMQNAERTPRPRGFLADACCVQISSFILHPSSFHRRRRRQGVSILEVMFAILVTVVGLLGAVAVFPAASAMARKGRITDASAAAGRSAFHDLDARMMRKPDRWITYSSPSWDFSTPPGTPGYKATIAMLQPNGTAPLGTAICIDPRAVAGAAQAAYDLNNPINFADDMTSMFPAVARQTIAGTLDPRMMRVTLTSGLKDAAGNLIYVPIPNGVTAAQGQSLANSMRLLADSVFTFDDDLSFERPTNDRSLPARQLYDYLGGS